MQNVGTATFQKSAEEVQRETGAYFVHPSNEPNVMAGQGTIALELFDQIHCHPQDSDPFDAVIVPIGGGGLISGITTTLRAINPRIKVIGAEPANADDAYRSKRDNELRGHEKPPQTIADGLKTTLGSNTWPIVRDLVDEIIPVSEEQICYATQLVWERMKIVSGIYTRLELLASKVWFSYSALNLVREQDSLPCWMIR